MTSKKAFPGARGMAAGRRKHSDGGTVPPARHPAVGAVASRAVALIAATALTVSGLVAAAASGALASAAKPAPGAPAPSVNIPMAIAGHGSAKPRRVDVRKLAPGPQLAVRHQADEGPLGRDGRPAGAGLPVRRSTGGKPTPGTRPALTSARSGANIAHGGAAQSPAAPHMTALHLAAPRLAAPHPVTGRALAGRAAAGRQGPLVAPATTNATFNGISEATADCLGVCQPPNPTAAVSPSQIAETANKRLEVYDKSGNVLCGVDLTTLLGTADDLNSPRIQYDNLNNRFSMAVTIENVAPLQSVPAMYVLATTSSNACGPWLVYRLTFNGGSFPLGSKLDYPYLGQDQGALLISTNNYVVTAGKTGGTTPNGSTVFTISKANIYNGLLVSFSAFVVAFSTAPVTVSGIPINGAANTYFLASVPGTGYDLYRMTNSAGPGTTMVLQATISSPFSSPPRRVNQPGTSQTLDPLDGRIQSPPVQSGNFVWFTHGMAIGSFPGIRYGAINVSTNTATVAAAYHSGTSDDFNPSIGVSDAASGGVDIWLNWAYTDTPIGVATSNTLDGVLPGTGVPNLIGTGVVPVNGFDSSSANLRGDFGAYSSVEVDPSAAGPGCAVGQTAVAVQEYFTQDGQWASRISRLSFC